MTLRKKRYLTSYERAEAMSMLDSGATTRQVCKKYGVSRQSVSHWRLNLNRRRRTWVQLYGEICFLVDKFSNDPESYLAALESSVMTYIAENVTVEDRERLAQIHKSRPVLVDQAEA